MREDELNRALMQQKAHEEDLHRRERELLSRELGLVEREIQVLIQQQSISKPEKRKGKFKKSRLTKLKAGGGRDISEPLGISICLFIFYSFQDFHIL